MSGPKRLIDMTWQLAWALLVCAVVFSFLRQRTLADPGAVTSDHPVGAGRVWINDLISSLCAMLFAIGIVVRLKRWLSARTAESERRRRNEASHTLVGAPERFGDRRGRRGRR